MEQTLYIHLDTGGEPRLVGRLWTHVRKGKESATFEYDADWLNHPNCFALEPALPLEQGPIQTAQGKFLFGALGDSTPDRWGRNLMRLYALRQDKVKDSAPRTFLEFDYLLGVDDESRQGALRFAFENGGPFYAGHQVALPLINELPRLLSAADHVVDDSVSDDDLYLLLVAGAPLGGARPKASIRDRDGTLCIAKFPRTDDNFNIVLWEGVALRLAAKSGIEVPDWKIEHVADKPVLILRRFDRVGDRRIPFLSALSMLDDSSFEQRSYLQFVDALRRHGANPIQDMHQMWRRIVFTVLISNTDDHFRNHAFLYTGPDGWRLSPAYDMNPVPTSIMPRILSTAIDEQNQFASLELAMSVAGYFELDTAEARTIAAEVGNAVQTWREEAAQIGLAKNEINRMASAFEHEDLKAATSPALTA